MESVTPVQHQQDVDFMRLALDLAAEAAAAGEVPVGAVVVKDGLVVGSGRNSPIRSADPTAHAEVLALRAASQSLGNYRLDGCTLYVTLEPCAMCCGAILHSRIQRVVFGAADNKTGCAGSVLNLFAQTQLNHQTTVQGGVLEAEAAQSLQVFFREKRALQRVQASPLRDDALRTPDVRFDMLEDYAWPAHYVSDLPILAGLRMHFLDLGPRDARKLLLCLHPVPGWSYVFHAHMDSWLGEGARVIAPDLIGFGKSDKPKRQELHSVDFHLQCLLQLLDRLGIQQVKLIQSATNCQLAQLLIERASTRVLERVVLPLSLSQPSYGMRTALDAPYPDAGHRAGERAFASSAFC